MKENEDDIFDTEMEDEDDKEPIEDDAKEESDEEILKQAQKDFKRSLDTSDDNRTNFIDDLKFGRLGEQWPFKVLTERQLEGRPCLVINRLPSFIRQVVNDARQNKPSIKVHPVDDAADVETAKIYDGLIRNIETISRADIAYDTAIDFAASAGFGYIRVETDYSHSDTFNQDILIKRVANPLNVYEDPDAESADGSDWNLCFVTEIIPKDKFKRDYPNAEKTSFESDSKEQKNVLWFDGDGIRIAEYWTRKIIKDSVLVFSNGESIKKSIYEKNDELRAMHAVEGIEIIEERETQSFLVMRYLITGTEVLEKDVWPGKYIPIVPVYGEELNVEGKRVFQSLIRQAKDSQRNFNYWRSAATELVALAPKAPWIGPVGFAKKDANWDTANTENHAYLEYDGPTKPERQPFAGMPAGALQEALSASDDLKNIMGIQDASLGAKSNETSGRAIMARQKEGDTSTFHFIDNTARSIRQTGAILIDLIPHIYSEKRIVRILGEDGTAQRVPINQPVMVNEKGEVMPPEKAHLDGIERIYDLGAGKYDLTVSAGPSFNTRREEAAFQMAEFIRAFPDAAPVIGDLLAKNLDWPGADEVAERLREINPVIQKEKQGNQPPPPSPEMIKAQADAAAAQQQAQIAQQKANSELSLRQVDLAIKTKELEMKQLDLAIKAKELEAQQITNAIDLKKAEVGLEGARHKTANEINKSNQAYAQEQSSQNFRATL